MLSFIIGGETMVVDLVHVLLSLSFIITFVVAYRARKQLFAMKVEQNHTLDDKESKSLNNALGIGIGSVGASADSISTECPNCKKAHTITSHKTHVVLS